MSLSENGGKDDFKPYILKRLTDFFPNEISETYVSAASLKDIKEDVFDNIEMLFGSSAHGSREELKDSRDIESSVLGYGITGYCGTIDSDRDRERILLHIVQQLRDFEPRIDPDSLEVELVRNKERFSSVMEFNISGRVSLGKLSDKISFAARLDTDTGRAELIGRAMGYNNG
jgi:predicted component of type VI protein secretion system